MPPWKRLCTGASIPCRRQDERELIKGDLGAGLLILCFRFDFPSLEMRIIQNGRRRGRGFDNSPAKNAHPYFDIEVGVFLYKPDGRGS
jgi:hypothetical protein